MKQKKISHDEETLAEALNVEKELLQLYVGKMVVGKRNPEKLMKEFIEKAGDENTILYYAYLIGKIAITLVQHQVSVQADTNNTANPRMYG
ncbi:MAG: hypothetical protein ACOC80_16730 [Petrotogales bacterium]